MLPDQIKKLVAIPILGLWAVLSMEGHASDEGDIANLAIDAALDSRSALYDLGVAFYAGRQLAQNYGNAALLWRKAAALGSIGAKNNLGYLLFHGLGVEKNPIEAVKLWRSAAQAGHSESQSHLGDAIYRGVGTDVDHVEGLAWVFCAARTAREPDRDEPELGGGQDVAQDADILFDLLSKSATPDEIQAAKTIATTQLCQSASAQIIGR